MTLTLGGKPDSVHAISMMEDDQGQLPVNGNTVEFDIKPYESLSFMVK